MCAQQWCAVPYWVAVLRSLYEPGHVVDEVDDGELGLADTGSFDGRQQPQRLNSCVGRVLVNFV